MDGKNIVSVFLLNGKTDATSKRVVEDIKKRFGKDITTGNFNYLHPDTKHIVLILPDNGFNSTECNFQEQKVIDELSSYILTGQYKVVLAYERGFDKSIEYYGISTPKNKQGKFTIVGLSNVTKLFMISVQKDVKQIINSKKEKDMDFDFSALDTMSEELTKKKSSTKKTKKPSVIIGGREVIGLRLKTEKEFKETKCWEGTQPVNWNKDGMPFECFGAMINPNNITQTVLENYQKNFEANPGSSAFYKTIEELFPITEDRSVLEQKYSYYTHHWHFDYRHLVPVYKDDTFTVTPYGSIIETSVENPHISTSEMDAIAQMDKMSEEFDKEVEKKLAYPATPQEVVESLIITSSKKMETESGTPFTLVEHKLVLSDPEKQREEIRKSIKEDIERKKSAMFYKVQALLDLHSSKGNSVLLIG